MSYVVLKVKSRRICFILKFGCLVCDPWVVHDFSFLLKVSKFDLSSIEIIWICEKSNIYIYRRQKLSAVIILINKIRDECHSSIDHSRSMGLIKRHRHTGSLIPAVFSLYDGDFRFRGGGVMLNADEMWMRYMRTIIM